MRVLAILLNVLFVACSWTIIQERGLNALETVKSAVASGRKGLDSVVFRIHSLLHNLIATGNTSLEAFWGKVLRRNSSDRIKIGDEEFKEFLRKLKLRLQEEEDNMEKDDQDDENSKDKPDIKSQVL